MVAIDAAITLALEDVYEEDLEEVVKVLLTQEELELLLLETFLNAFFSCVLSIIEYCVLFKTVETKGTNNFFLSNRMIPVTNVKTWGAVLPL